MNYVYLRVSTGRQTVENQRYDLEKFVTSRDIVVDEWVQETVSGLKCADERLLGGLLAKMKKGDVLVVAEISRLGRNMLAIMSILNDAMKKECIIYAVKGGYELGNNLTSKVIAFGFGLAAEIERDLISQRTKEALARKKAEGVILGRPKGSRARTRKLLGKEDEIQKLLDQKVSVSAIGRILGVHRLTVSDYMKTVKK